VVSCATVASDGGGGSEGEAARHRAFHQGSVDVHRLSQALLSTIRSTIMSSAGADVLVLATEGKYFSNDIDQSQVPLHVQADMGEEFHRRHCDRPRRGRWVRARAGPQRCHHAGVLRVPLHERGRCGDQNRRLLRVEEMGRGGRLVMVEIWKFAWPKVWNQVKDHGVGAPTATRGRGRVAG
jgi:hypothetical protein